MHTQSPSAYAQAKAARKQQRKQREAAYADALRRYSEAQRAARLNGSTRPNMADFWPNTGN